MTCVDLFAGLGGFSAGAEAAGYRVLWAANHWSDAVRWHRANHPEATHACQDLHQCDWATVPDHDVLLASPACQGHCRARGKDRPHHDSARSTAWAVVSALEAKRPAHFVVENVPEFARWALFPCWEDAVRRLGYSIGRHVLDAADFGVPQHRIRLFLVGSRGGTPAALRLDRAARVRTAREIVDLDAGTWSPVLEKCPSTRRKCAAGRVSHGRRFLVAYYGNERGGRSLDHPLGTVTTRDRYAVVDGPRMRMLSVSEYRAAMGFPEGYSLPSNRRLAIHLLGNAVCPPVASAVLRALAAH